MNEHLRPPDHRPEVHAHRSPTREHTVFVLGRRAAARERQERRRKEVPEMRRRAGEITKKLRTETLNEDIPAEAFGDIIGISGPDITNFETNDKVVNITKIYFAAKSYFDPETEEMRELKQIRNFVDEEQLLWILKQEDMTTRRAIKLLRLIDGDSFKNKLGITQQQLSNVETGRSSSRSNLVLINKIIIETLTDHESMPAQFIRLLSAQGGPMNPMSLDELQKCTFGQLFKYLRTLRGVTQEELGEELKYSNRSIRDFESGRKMKEETLSQLLFWLKIAPDSALSQILIHKNQNPLEPEQIQEELLTGVLTQQYLFAEHLQEIHPQATSQEDKQLLSDIQDNDSLVEVQK